jgi:hypothetical protein
MISAVSSLAIATAFGLKTPFFAPAVFISRFFKREISAMLFFFYCIFLGYEFSVSDFFEIDLAALALLLSTLLLLDEIISSRRKNLADYFLAAVAFAGFLNPDLIIAVLIVAFLNVFLNDRPRIGFVVFLCPLFAYLFIAFLKEAVAEWSLSAEVLALASFSVMIFLLSTLIGSILNLRKI